MKTADDYRKEWAFGKCTKHGLSTIAPQGSIHCGECLTETFAIAIAESRKAAIEDCAKVAEKWGNDDAADEIRALASKEPTSGL